MLKRRVICLARFVVYIKHHSLVIFHRSLLPSNCVDHFPNLPKDNSNSDIWCTSEIMGVQIDQFNTLTVCGTVLLGVGETGASCYNFHSKSIFHKNMQARDFL